MVGQGIKLKARDAEDLAVLAACLQDAVVAPRDMTWLRKEKRFILVATRFRWENGPEVTPPAVEEDASFEQAERLYSRVNCGLAFGKVTRVQTRNLDTARRDQLLNLLTLRLEGSKAVRLLFSGGVEIRLEVTGLAAFLEDLGESWPTQWRPEHAMDGALDDQAPAG